MVPKLRFAGFCDKWNSSTLSDAGVQIIDGDRGSNYPSSGDFRPMGFCLFLNAGNVTRDGFRFDNVMFITEEKDSELRKGKLQRRDIVLTTRGTIGNTAIYNNQVSFEHIRINSGMVLVRTKQTLTPDFLYLYFSSGYFSSWLNKVAFGSAQPQLTVKIINALSVYFPGKNEQIKIADFLSSVDEKITLLSKQHDLLCQYKKGMMQKIFSQEVRFKDENGKDFPEWKQKKIREITSLIKDGTHGTHNNVTESDFFLLSAKNIQEGKVAIDKNDRKISEIEFRSIFKNYDLEPGDILLSVVGTIGRVAIYSEQYSNYAFQRSVAFFRFPQEIPEFIYQLFNATKFQKELLIRQVISAQPGIYLGDLADISLEIPVQKEQMKIANFLSALDDKIAVTKAELDMLKTWKQGLLQQMFV